MKAALLAVSWVIVVLVCFSTVTLAQSASGQPAASAKVAPTTTSELEHEFFAVIRTGDALKLLSYIPEDGVNLGRGAEHTSREAIEEQLTHRTGLYCKLFDSACMSGATAACSYRELLTLSETFRTASMETTRNGVRQAILVAQVQNQKCGGAVLIDFIFNHQQGGWKLFSVP